MTPLQGSTLGADDHKATGLAPRLRRGRRPEAKTGTRKGQPQQKGNKANEGTRKKGELDAGERPAQLRPNSDHEQVANECDVGESNARFVNEARDQLHQGHDLADNEVNKGQRFANEAGHQVQGGR